MHSTLLKLIYNTLFIVVVSAIGLTKANAQEIDENHIFYSPSDEQMGSLTFLNAKQKMFSNNNVLLLLGEKTKHLDTLSLDQHNFSGFIQNITVLNDSLFSISTMTDFLKVGIENNQFKVIDKLNKKDLKKNKISCNQFIFLSQGFIILNMNSKKDKVQYQIEVYSSSFKKLFEKQLQLTNTIKNNFSYTSIAYPHNYYINKEGALCFSATQAKTFVRMNTSSGKFNLIDLASQSQASEGIDIFYNRADDAYHLVKYMEVDSDETRLTIYKVNPLTFDNYKLNELVIPLRKVRGGFHQGDILIMDDFKGALGFYLVPINELHKL
ncbi:MAG: hypothetical protein ACJAT1_001829 [Marivirga sp.]|jgi:hypothetical protein